MGGGKVATQKDAVLENGLRAGDQFRQAQRVRAVGRAHRYLGPPNLPSGIARLKRASRIVADEQVPPRRSLADTA